MVDSYTLRHPECLGLVTGDFNPTSTNIAPTPFKRSCGLTQIINVLTRDSRILDWCLTNKPKAFCAPSQLPKLGSSDHYCVLIKQGPRGQILSRQSRGVILRQAVLELLGVGLQPFLGMHSLRWIRVKTSLIFSSRLCLLQLIDTCPSKYHVCTVLTNPGWHLKSKHLLQRDRKPSHSSAKILHPSTCGVTRCRRR